MKTPTLQQKPLMKLQLLEGSATEEAIRLAAVEHFTGKVVIDTTNPIADVAPTNDVLHYFTTLEESLMELIQQAIPEAKVVKGFSIVGNVFMYKPGFPGGKPTMFICSNDAEVKKTVT